MPFSWLDLLGTGIYFSYFLTIAGILWLVGRFTKYPREMLRKSFHFFCILSIFILLEVFENWYSAIGAAIALLLVAYVVVIYVEKRGLFQYMSIARKKKKGEVPRQIIYLLAAIALLLVFFWGILGPNFKYIASLGFIALAFGDAAAALIGKRFGKKRFRHPFFDRKKTREGTLAMVGASFIGIFIILCFSAPTPFYINLPLAMILAVVAGLVEAVSKRGIDTITIPVITSCLAAPLLALVRMLGGG